MARGRLLVLTVLVAVSIGGCGPNLPGRVAPPAAGETAEIGVAYGVVVYCGVPIELGGLWWVFPAEPVSWPPAMEDPFPFSIWANVASPYEVPGVVTLSSPTEAVFRADSDGSKIPLSGYEENPAAGAACL
jgi:hypothetical protein